MPVVTLDNAVLYYEGLARVECDKRFLLPAQFLPELTAAELVPELDSFILTLATTWLQDCPDMVLGLNISATTARNSAWQQLLSQSMTAPIRQRLILELSDIQSDEEWDGAEPIFDWLHNSGIRLALGDIDFSEGQRLQPFNDHFAQLFQLPVSFAKLDREFVERACEAAYGDPSFDALTLLRKHAEAHNVRLIAEGVEQPSQIEFLEGMGITLLQGFLVGKPAFVVPGQTTAPPKHTVTGGVAEIISKKVAAIESAIPKRRF
jgi:EAL domain-containing protein (putative c-di-GMP-specific phosphodiesterase class I)